jgi:hypothetical protein
MITDAVLGFLVTLVEAVVYLLPTSPEFTATSVQVLSAANWLIPLDHVIVMSSFFVSYAVASGVWLLIRFLLKMVRGA